MISLFQAARGIVLALIFVGHVIIITLSTMSLYSKSHSVYIAIAVSLSIVNLFVIIISIALRFLFRRDEPNNVRQVVIYGIVGIFCVAGALVVTLRSTEDDRRGLVRDFAHSANPGAMAGVLLAASWSETCFSLMLLILAYKDELPGAVKVESRVPAPRTRQRKWHGPDLVLEMPTASVYNLSAAKFSQHPHHTFKGPIAHYPRPPPSKGLYDDWTEVPV
ncbi:hypothetical protein PLICRDRAFT_54597 [Plicaturopsis crispa FD-325 SS-3]|nr:hypothetical protein PLICRDRAFT_54597 [Plicaturopsis crispa FD-325 SS-3]